MKKVLTITLCFVLLLSAASFATKTRVKTMGDNNEILLDEANIWLFPSRLFDYPDVAIADFNSSDGYVFPDKDAEVYSGNDFYFHEFGVHWKFGKDKPFVLGTYLYNSVGQYYDEAYLGAQYWPVGLGMLINQFGGSIFNSSEWGVPDDDLSNKRISLFYSRELGGHKFGFAFHKLHSSERDEDDEGNTTFDESFSRYNFSLGLTEASGMWDVAAHVQMITWKDKGYGVPPGGSEATELDQTKPAGNMTFTVLGRYFKQMNPVITLVPHASFVYGKFESEDYFVGGYVEDPNTNKLNTLAFTVGGGMHYQPSAGMLAVIDFGLSYAKADFEFVNAQGTEDVTDETNTTILTLPYAKMGFEGEVFDWMQVRFGATTYWRDITEEDIEDGETDDKDFTRFPDNMTYLGLEFNWNRLTIDAWANPEMFLDGFNFISGSTNEMNAGLSAIYSF
ncbi:hypothetical protein GF420_12585 [candidate division GN15 bacterium]|nr:hypothetical protein [candidate division GN15 bacterium]